MCRKVSLIKGMMNVRHARACSRDSLPAGLLLVVANLAEAAAADDRKVHCSQMHKVQGETFWRLRRPWLNAARSAVRAPGAGLTI